MSAVDAPGAVARPRPAGRPLAIPREPVAGTVPSVACLMRDRPPAVDPDDRLASAAARMRRACAAALPVLESGRLVAVITERDILLAVADGLSTDVVRVGSYMRPVPCVIGPDAAAAVAVTRMVEHRVHHLLVVREGEVLGLLTAVDLLRALGGPLELLGDDREVRFV